MSRAYKICFLAYGKLYEKARAVIDEMENPELDILLLECNVETLHAAVDQATRKGYEVFIAWAANAAEFRRYSQRHLTEMRLGSVDYLAAIQKALSIGQRPAIAVYRFSRQFNPEQLASLSGAEITVLSYEDSEELYHAIATTDADVIIGASHAVQVAEELCKKSVLLSLSEHSIRNAIQRAYTLAAELRKDIRRNRFSQAIIENAPFGITISDEDGHIVLYNQALCRHAGLEQHNILGRSLAELIPALDPSEFQQGDARQVDRRRLINGAMLRCVQTRVAYDDQTLGVLTTLYPDNSRKNKVSAESSAFTAQAKWKNAVSSSAAFQEMMRQARPLTDQAHPLIIMGEAGSGREYVAQCIHNASMRSKDPYVVINAAALPDQDAPRILFGTEDTTGVHAGLLELVQGGTVVLQNLAYATDAVQSCLLQVMTTRQFMRLGTTAQIPFRARFIALVSSEEMRGRIKDDLWQRLVVFQLTVPPLRERTEDILPLFSRFCEAEGLPPAHKYSAEFRQILQFYSWPGNLAELQTVCRRYVFLHQQMQRPNASARRNILVSAIGEDNLFAEILRRYPALQNPAGSSRTELQDGIQQIKQLLKYNNDQIAARLSISRTTLWRLIRNSDSE